MFHKHGGDIYEYERIRDFSANINFLGMPESVRSAAEKSIEQSVHYPDPEYRSLRRDLACRENMQDGMPCGKRIMPSQIICGNGAAELMFALAAAKRPKQALLAVPSFFEYEQALSAFGCEVRYFYLKEKDGYVLKNDFLESVDEETDMIVLGNPNNPTGRFLDEAFLLELLALCRKQNILLVLDESFFDFLCMEDQMRTFSGILKVGEDPNLFVLKSFTKMYAMPGLRFGYGVCSDEALLEKMRQLMQPWNVSVPAQAAAQAAAKESDFAKKTAELTAENRKEMKRQLEQDGYRVFPSNTNFLLFQGAEHLKEFCLQHGYLIRDCSNFPGLQKGYFRICVRSKEENKALLETLKEAAKQDKRES